MMETKTKSPTAFPDDDTLLMAMYGSAYSETTLRTAQIDKIIEACKAEQEKILSKIDHDTAHRILTESSFLLFADLPQNTKKNVERTVQSLRKYLRYHLAIDLLIEQRKKTIQYGGFIGAGECGIVKQTKGTSPDDWRRAAMRYRSQFLGGRP